MRGTQLNRITEFLDDLHIRWYAGYRPDANSLVHHHLSPDGDPGMVTNASGQSVTLSLWAPAGKLYVVQKSTVYVEDSGQFNADKYGAVTGGLANGIDLQRVTDSGASVLFRFGALSHIVQHNGDWAKYGDTASKSEFATGNNWLKVDIAWGAPLVINGDNNDGLQFIMNDDFTELSEHEFISKGLILDI